MTTFLTLIQTFGLGTVIIILIVSIPLLIKGWRAYKKIKKEAQEHDDALLQQGAAAQEQRIKLEQRLNDGSNRMQALEQRDDKIEKLIENQQKEISLLIQSDELDIKAYITEKYYYYIPKGYIDAEVLDILEHRFAIYKLEGGNGFAERMMNELRQLPLISTHTN